MKKLLLISFIMLTISVFAQKRQVVEYRENIVAHASTELDSVCKNIESGLMKEITEAGIHGRFVFNLSIREKGEVATVLVVNSGDNDIKMQNRLKDIIKRYRFGFKMPKGKIYKFEYTFNL